MGTIRVARRDRYLVVTHQLVNDTRLTFRARGLLVWLLSQPDDWRTNSSNIAHLNPEGRDAIRAALRELERHGYLVRRRTQHPQTGTWTTETWVYETPQACQPTLNLVDNLVDNPPKPVDNPPTEDGFPGVGFPGAITKH